MAASAMLVFHENIHFSTSHIGSAFMRPIPISNLVTIAQTVSELQFFFEIQDGGVRHVGFYEKLIFHILYW